MKMESLLKDAMEEAVRNNLVAGVNLLVEKDGKEVCYLETGMADVENGKPFRRDTILRLYSQSKPVTAAGAMLLMERGKIDLGDPVSDYLPGFRDVRVWQDGGLKIPARGVIIQDLLNMTSGLTYPDPVTESGRQTAQVFEKVEAGLRGGHPMTTIEIANALGQCVLEFEPGTSFRYGTSADVLGAVIEVVSGMRFGDFLEKEIFAPLGMKDTGFWVQPEKQDRLAKAYETVSGEEGKRLVHYTGDNLGIWNQMDERPAFESGGAGLASTLDDYMRFAEMLLNGGELDGARILKPETVRFLTGAQLAEGPQKAMNQWFGLGGYSYGNLMRVMKEPSRAMYFVKEGEYGWDGWLGAYFANFPKEKMTILIGMQKKDSGTWALTRKLRNIIVSSLC